MQTVCFVKACITRWTQQTLYVITLHNYFDKWQAGSISVTIKNADRNKQDYKRKLFNKKRYHNIPIFDKIILVNV